MLYVLSAKAVPGATTMRAVPNVDPIAIRANTGASERRDLFADTDQSSGFKSRGGRRDGWVRHGHLRAAFDVRRAG
jgi:hypothetical protein